ncbi:helix-turn-helix domain-containing protein [Kribbella qitaiheensis]|uniref:Helix-turn-helix domain-containing protein n=1 Tax=Kribbella qitaiheensis TaxID=1544730 RepID=A0A7G6X608_9ACTN|nr:helix-turn-helix domain-containing protein [Kribbella qitaiheensis]QNE21673.1 helix-turn-helix domain-containing protein [Kribbella qitaiheensis]
MSDADGRAEGRRDFADLLLDLRVQAGLSQEELADRAGLSVRTIRELEAGRVARPRKDSARLLAEGLGLRDGDAGKFLVAAGHATVRPVIAVAAPAPAGLRWRGTRPIPDGLVGRETELIELEGLLRQNRLVTLVGPGGVGKTELALAAADRFSGADTTVVVVDLTTVQRDAAVASAILDAFGTAPGTSDLDDVLAGRKPGDLVIVEDNAEHVLDGVATVANRMVRSYPGIGVLVTSRIPLGLPHEVVRRVQVLGVPANDKDFAEIAASPAVEMFVRRAARVRPGFQLTQENSATVARLCQRLDGLPLALELAAARAGSLSVETILAALDDRFRLLSGPRRFGAPHQRTLADTIAWSVDALSDPARQLLYRASMLGSPFTLDAVVGVCTGLPIEAADVPMLLAELVDKSLLQPVLEFEALYGARYKMLETIREHAYAGLSSQDEDLTEFRDRTVTWCSTYVEGLDGAWSSPDRDRRYRAANANSATFEVALERAAELGEWDTVARIVLGFRVAWQYQASVAESGIQWAGAAAEHVTDKETSGRLLAIAGRLSNLTGDVRAARRHYGEARTLMPPESEMGLVARAGWVSSGSVLLDTVSLAEIPTLVEDARGHGDPQRSATVQAICGLALARWGRLPEAKELLLAWAAALSNPGVYPDEIAYMALSRVELELGNLDEARRWAELARDSQASDDPERTKVAGCLAMVEFQAGKYDQARSLLDEADADIRGHRGYFDYLVMLYRSRLARQNDDAEQARLSIRDAVSRLLAEGRVVYLLDVLPEAVAVLHALGQHEQADQLCGQLLAWQRTMDPPMLPTAWEVLQESCAHAPVADGWPEPDPAESVQRLADDVLTALS